MDKLREEFEQWWNNKMAMCFYSQPKSQKETIYHASWLAWQASRASIVVELPEIVGYGMINRGEILANLRSIGLSIKGDGE
ncbi:hypothetical protein IHE77_13850 [Serratia ureilytica]|uniref:hypothetical protein n=1 Tax=Serratia ureilytica TaxID=300181 RepID=UPI001F4D1361|nr:hypothetical protein [Serratia ureilytica]UNE41970.1 hypothetical protein IHE77_13850 [Serratia ureilytica]